MTQTHVPEPTRARILSGTEASAGPWLRLIPDRVALRLSDSEFTILTRMRHGLPVTTHEAACQHCNAGEDGKCGEILDPDGIHATTCRTGPTRYRGHDAATQALGKIGKDAGAEVHKELAIPELHQHKVNGTWQFTQTLTEADIQRAEKAREARMDLVIWHSSMPGLTLVDATIRNPLSRKYLHEAATTPGHALQDAQKDKRRRYGFNTPVLCAGVELYGLLSPDMRTVLHTLDEIHANTHPECKRSRYAHWAADLQTAVARATARNIATANNGRGGCPFGSPRQHRHPVHRHRRVPPYPPRPVSGPAV